MIEGKINEIINQFDFKRVQKAMFALDWEWYSSEGVPSIKEMKDCAKSLLSHASEKIDSTVMTGGFLALHSVDGDLSLSFEL